MTPERENKQNIIFCVIWLDESQMVGWPISSQVCTQPAVLKESTTFTLFFSLNGEETRKGVESKDTACGTVLGHYEKYGLSISRSEEMNECGLRGGNRLCVTSTLSYSAIHRS
jgi:hypothetical protein